MRAIRDPVVSDIPVTYVICFVFNHFIFFAVPEPELMTATPTI